MKKMLKYFLDNVKITISLLSIIILCFSLLFIILYLLDLILVMISSPVVTFIVSALFMVVAISVLLTLFDMFSNKSD